MTKQKKNHVAINDFETQANEFISLTFDHCEEELRQSRACRLPADNAKRQALAAAAMSVQQSVNTFLAISRIATHK